MTLLWRVSFPSPLGAVRDRRDKLRLCQKPCSTKGLRLRPVKDDQDHENNNRAHNPEWHRIDRFLFFWRVLQIRYGHCLALIAKSEANTQFRLS